jgi:hypothetical protein
MNLNYLQYNMSGAIIALNGHFACIMALLLLSPPDLIIKFRALQSIKKHSAEERESGSSWLHHKGD